MQKTGKKYGHIIQTQMGIFIWKSDSPTSINGAIEQLPHNKRMQPVRQTATRFVDR
jgi:hypothetical protein